MRWSNRRLQRLASPLLAITAALALGCDSGQSPTEGDDPEVQTVPHEGRYGIYSLDLATKDVSLIHSTSSLIFTSTLSLNSRGDTLAFAQRFGCAEDSCFELAVVGIDGGGLRQVTSNQHWDLYPAFSPDDGMLAFLSWRDADLDIYVVNSDGTGETMLFDSGSHDADVDWKGDRIVFTSGCRIWSMNPDGTGASALTDPPQACEWGNANLPFGDYDPRLNQAGTKVVFERLENDTSPHGNYNLFSVNSDGSNEVRLSSTGYAQGLATWSHSGNEIAFLVSAIDGAGKYRLYMMNADGTNNRDVTPTYFPPEFLCHAVVFSRDDSKLYFIGEWWQ